MLVENMTKIKLALLSAVVFWPSLAGTQLQKIPKVTGSAGVLNVREFGAVGDGETDNTRAIQAAIAAMADGGTLYFPTGTYRVSSTVDLSSKQSVSVLGDSVRSGTGNIGSVITGNFIGTLVRYVPFGSGNSIFIRGITFYNPNSDSSSKALHIQNIVNGSIENSQILSSGGFGIYAPADVFTFRLSSVVFAGSLSTHQNSIGLYIGGNTVVLEGCEFTGWAEGIRYFTGMVMLGGRFEVNKKGVVVGMNKDGEANIGFGFFSGITFEGNDTAIYVNAANNVTFSNIVIQGHTGAPSGQSEYGIRIVGPGSGMRFQGVSLSDSYSKAGFSVEHGSSELEIDRVLVTNVFNGGKTWDIRNSYLTNTTFRASNFKVRPDDAIAKEYLQRHGMFQYLAQIEHLNANVEGKNLRGKNIPITGGESSKAIVFTGSHTPAQSDINAIVPADTGGTLAAGKYYYRATAVTAHGESASLTERSVTVSGTNDSVRLTFYNMKQDGFKRRIYRGMQPGVYDGYFETALNSNATFTDNGGAFNGRRSPPVKGIDDTSMIEPDANYAVLVTPSWNTTYWVTGKTTTGFTINFGTAAPANGGTVDYFMVR